MDVAEIVAVHSQVLQSNAGERGSKLPAGIEIEDCADILPGRLRAGRVGVALVEQLPGAAARLRPADLDIYSIAFLVVGGNRTTFDRLAGEGRHVVGNDGVIGRIGGVLVDTEL